MHLSVTTVDFVVVVVLLVSTGYGVYRGFLWETLTVFAWVAAAFACLYFAPVILPLTSSMVTAPWMARLLAYAVMFLAVLIPLAFMSHRLSQTVKSSPIGPFDRALGAVFGLARGLVIVGVAYIAFTYFVPVPKQPVWLSKAKMLPLIQDTDEVLLTLIPARDKPGFALWPEGSRKSAREDDVGDLIRQDEPQESPDSGQSVQHKSAGKAKKRYGEADRQALDKLVESSGNSQ